MADISAAADYTEDYFNSNFVDHVEKSQLFYQSAWFLLGQNGLRITLNMAHKLRKQERGLLLNYTLSYLFFGFIISYLVKFEGERQNIVKLSVLLKKGNLQKEQNVYV